MVDFKPFCSANCLKFQRQKHILEYERISPKGQIKMSSLEDANGENPILPEDASLLIVDDDEPFRNRLGRAMEKRGFKTILAAGASENRTRHLRQRTTPPHFGAGGARRHGASNHRRASDLSQLVVLRSFAEPR